MTYKSREEFEAENPDLTLVYSLTLTGTGEWFYYFILNEDGKMACLTADFSMHYVPFQSGRVMDPHTKKGMKLFL